MSDLIATTVSRISTMRTVIPLLAGKSHNKRDSLARLQQGPQISNNAETFQMEYSVDQIRAFRRAEDGRDEVGGLGDNFVAGHRLYWRAADVVDPLAEVRAIRQRNVDDGHAHRQETVQLRIWNVEALSRLPKNSRAVQPRL